MMKAWLLDEMFRFHRAALTVEGSQGEWGAGDSIAEEEELPPAPANVAAKCGNGRITITWDPVPDAMYYNLYFQTTKGVQIKFSELTRPIAGPEDFKTVIGVKKEKATCLEGAQSPFVHDDLANGSCYHYVVTVVTAKGESPESQEVMTIPSPYLLAACIGQEGVDEGEFSSPTGITLDKEGNLYVADTDNHSIQKFDKTGKFVARWGGEPSSQEGNFYYPRGLAVGANDAVYVADSGNNRVQKFDLDGNVMQSWGKFGFAWRGADMGKFDVPWGVATDQEGNLYVSDTSNARIQKFKADGTPLVKWGRDGSFDGAFFFPRGVAVDFVGNIYVADEGNNRVQKFDARGSFLTKWGREGAGPGQFKTPWGIACDALGNVYVVDTGNHRIQKFDGNGTFLCAWGNRGKSEGQLNFPYGIAVDKEGCVYVVDSGNNRVLKYVPTDEEINRGKDEKPKSQATTATPPPSNVAVKAGDTETFLSWLEVPGAISYNLYFNTSPQLTKQSGTKIEGVTNPFTHSGLTNDTAYFYSVAAVFDGDVESELSNQVSATPVLIDITAPQNSYAVINHGAFMTNTPEVVVTISANDIDTGVGAYYVSEAPMTPMAGTPGWVDVDAGIEIRRHDSVHPVSRATARRRFTSGSRTSAGTCRRRPARQFWSIPRATSACRIGDGLAAARRSSTAAEFMAPIYGLCADQQGALFVVDNGNNRIQKFDNTGNFIILWGNFGAANANFHNPDRHRLRRERRRVGRRYEQPPRPEIRRQVGWLPHEVRLARQWRGSVQLPMGYCRGSRPRVCLRRRQRQLPGAEIRHDRRIHHVVGQLRQRRRSVLFCARVAVDQSDGAVYVVDMGNHRVQKFDTSTNVLPQLLTKWGGSAEAGHASSPLSQEAGQLRSPWGIALDAAGDVYVTDTGNHRIEKFDKEGNFITQWGGYGNGDGQFNFPYGHCGRCEGQRVRRRQRQHPRAAVHAG